MKIVGVEVVTRLKTRSPWVDFGQKWSFCGHNLTKPDSTMVISIKPLPSDSDSSIPGKGHGLQSKTVMNSGYFWDNYCKFRPILKVNKMLYLEKMDFCGDLPFSRQVGGKWIILDHKMHEGRAWIKAKRIRNRRNLRNAEHWIPAEVFGKKEPASLAFYIFENSLFLVDPAWEIGNDFFNWLSVEPVSLKDFSPRRRMPRRQKQVSKFAKLRKYIDI